MVSIFSDLNHLEDMTLSEEFANIVGITEDEIKSNFNEHLDVISKKLKMTNDVLISEMRKMYNGYLFNHNAIRVFNPFSLLNFLKQMEFNNYWYSTGTPTFLLELLRNKSLDITQELPKIVDKDFINKFDLKQLDKINVWTLLYQTGYLTIKEYDEELDAFYLDFPNKEVKNSFLNNILEVYSFDHTTEISSSVVQINKGLIINNWNIIVEQLNIIFAGIPYQIFKSKYEFYYHSIVHAVISLTGADTLSEVQTSKGRIDCIIRTKQLIYIIEFKIGTPDEALRQIEQNEYFKRFMNDSRPIHMIGVGFDKKKREISGWKGKEVIL